MLQAKPRPKIRRGHWRRQPCGVERLSRKRIWVKTRIKTPDGKTQVINDQPPHRLRGVSQQELTLT